MNQNDLNNKFQQPKNFTFLGNTSIPKKYIEEGVQIVGKKSYYSEFVFENSKSYLNVLYMLNKNLKIRVNKII